MRAGHGNHLRLELPQVRFPEVGVPLFGPPAPGWLAALDLEVQMGPAAAAPLLAERADAIAQLEVPSRLHSLVDFLQMAVAIVPASRVEQVNHVVARTDGRVLAMFGEHLQT